MNAAPSVRFRPLERNDFELLLRWLNAEHVRRWWDAQGYTMEQVQEKYEPRIEVSSKVHCYIGLADEQPVGYIQAYWLKDFSEYADQIRIAYKEGKFASIDFFMGEPTEKGKGIGTLLLTSFLQQIVFDGLRATHCIVGPDAENHRAIRVYEKAGFKPLWIVKPSDDEPAEQIMQIEFKTSAYATHE